VQGLLLACGTLAGALPFIAALYLAITLAWTRSTLTLGSIMAAEPRVLSSTSVASLDAAAPPAPAQASRGRAMGSALLAAATAASQAVAAAKSAAESAARAAADDSVSKTPAEMTSQTAAATEQLAAARVAAQAATAAIKKATEAAEAEQTVARELVAEYKEQAEVRGGGEGCPAGVAWLGETAAGRGGWGCRFSSVLGLVGCSRAGLCSAAFSTPHGSEHLPGAHAPPHLTAAPSPRSPLPPPPAAMQPLPLPFELARPTSPTQPGGAGYTSASSLSSSSETSADSAGEGASRATSPAQDLLADAAYWDRLYATFREDDQLLQTAVGGQQGQGGSQEERSYANEDLRLAKSALHTRFDELS
jgi:hypothetical protein